jgi:hypothetical protein
LNREWSVDHFPCFLNVSQQDIGDMSVCQTQSKKYPYVTKTLYLKPQKTIHSSRNRGLLVHNNTNFSEKVIFKLFANDVSLKSSKEIAKLFSKQGMYDTILPLSRLLAFDTPHVDNFLKTLQF